MESPSPPSGDRAKVSVMVRADIEQAFRAFTREIDLWWRRGPQYRSFSGDRGFMHLEPHLHGRIFESLKGKDGGETVVESGRITVWQPPSHFTFAWRAVNFGPQDKDTYVDVRFRAMGDKTEVTIEHYGWAAVRLDHPVRHSLPPKDFIAMMGKWWGGLMASYRRHLMP